MSKELDIAVARAMGFRVVRDRQNVRGCQVGPSGRKGHDLPYYSEDAALIPVLLAWIETHGLKDRYMYQLGTLQTSANYEEDRYMAGWKLITATPDQHCRAFIACTQAQ